MTFSSMSEAFAAAIGITGIVILILLLIILGPVIGIWTINTLFHTNTAYTFWTWLAAFLFFGSLRGVTSSKK